MTYSYIVLSNLSRLTSLVGIISTILLIVIMIIYLIKDDDDEDEVVGLPTNHLKKVTLILVYIMVTSLVFSVFLPSPEELKILYNMQ